MMEAAEVELLAWAGLLSCDPIGLLRCADPAERLVRVAIVQRAARLRRDMMRAQAQMIAGEVSRLFRR